VLTAIIQTSTPLCSLHVDGALALLHGVIATPFPSSKSATDFRGGFAVSFQIC
jgi:hypothetical protein